MKITQCILLSAGFLFSFEANAKCESIQKTIFACTTTSKKVVAVCDAGKTIDYTFGKLGALPELSLRVPRDDVSTHQWEGMGRSMTYTVNIPNGETVYSAFSSVDRLSDKHELEAGITVEVKKKHVATIKCIESTIVNNMEGVKLKPASD